MSLLKSVLIFQILTDQSPFFISYWTSKYSYYCLIKTFFLFLAKKFAFRNWKRLITFFKMWDWCRAKEWQIHPKLISTENLVWWVLIIHCANQSWRWHCRMRIRRSFHRYASFVEFIVDKLLELLGTCFFWHFWRRIPPRLFLSLKNNTWLRWLKFGAGPVCGFVHYDGEEERNQLFR